MDWHPSYYWLQVMGYWQTLLTGVLALGAAWWTVSNTTKSANREIEAASQQTEMARRQIETSLILDRARNARELQAFATAAGLAGRLVLSGVEYARVKVPPRPPGTGPSTRAAYNARQSLICPILAELRPACVKFGGDVARAVIALDAYITSITNQWDPDHSPTGVVFQSAPEGGFHEALDEIETQAQMLIAKAATALEQSQDEIRITQRELDRLI
jgi:hypothetical protein